jgi:hypothetical protein
VALERGGELIAICAVRRSQLLRGVDIDQQKQRVAIGLGELVEEEQEFGCREARWPSCVNTRTKSMKSV